MVAYGSTEVSAYKSQDAIRKILVGHGAKGVQYSENFETREIVVKFAIEVSGNLRTIKVGMTVPQPPQPKRARRRSYRLMRGKIVYDKLPQEKQEQMMRATYRALHYWLKSNFEAIDFGLMKIEDVFLSHFEWMIDGKPATVGELIRPYIERPQLNAPEFDADVVDAE